MERPDELTDADIERVLAVLHAGSFDLVELEVDGVRIVASNVPTQAGPRTAESPSPPVDLPPITLVGSPAPSAADTTRQPMPPGALPPTELAASAAEAVGSDELVTAPMAGIFYRRPSPGAPPFVEVGTAVPAGETIGLIEVMKLFTAIKADASGVLTEFLAEDGEQVIQDQPLIRLAQQAT